MNFWLNANLSPKLARWIESQFKCSCKTLSELGLHHAKDSEIFAKARAAKAIVITKDADFRDLVLKNGAPPQVLWITCGNTSTKYLSSVLERLLPKAIELLTSGQPLVEISD